MTTSSEWHLTRRPQGVPVDEDFALVEVELPVPSTGEILVRNTFLSVDPYMRGRMNDAKSYAPPFQLNHPMDGGAVGTVEQAGADAVDSEGIPIAVGDTVAHALGWRTTSLVQATHARVLDTRLAPAQAYLGVLGMTGLTAYAGLLRVGEFAQGDRVFVSAAAGAVGSMVGQIARLKGASFVVGSAGGPEKTSWLLDEARFDAAVDYKATPIRKGLAEAAPEGIDVYFDNTAGPQLEAALYVLRDHGRVAMCGGIAGYNTPVPGPRNLMLAIAKRLRLEGFIVMDHYSDLSRFLAEAVPALKSGKLINRETVVEGLDAAPAAFLDLLHPGASNFGKMIVKLAD
jgi:NADPH-dependent curcumin reductase CurA